jgi:drug/metabolite transporter (DMT)-like permease
MKIQYVYLALGASLFIAVSSYIIRRIRKKQKGKELFLRTLILFALMFGAVLLLLITFR